VGIENDVTTAGLNLGVSGINLVIRSTIIGKKATPDPPQPGSPMHELRLADAATATAPNVVVANIVGTVVASDLVVV